MERRPGVKYKWGGRGELLSGGEADAKNNSVNARGRECACIQREIVRVLEHLTEKFVLEINRRVSRLDLLRGWLVISRRNERIYE